MGVWARLFGNLAGTAMTLAAVAAFALLLVVRHLSGELPNYQHLSDYAPPVMSRAHAGDGGLIAEYAQERRLFVPLDAIPTRLIDAFLAAEDKGFYDHIGIDFMGIVRAAFRNVAHVVRGERLEGASTITQQVAKNFLLSSEVTFKRKMQEILLALRLERAFTKRQLLELYLNEIYLGMGTYGVAAAALDYFDKPLDALTYAEAAYLAALPKAPNNYHPTRNRARALARRNWVLDRMEANGALDPATAALARAEDLTAHGRRRGAPHAEAAHYVEEVRRKLYDLYGEKQLYGGGLSIRTTLDLDTQRIAVRALRAGLTAYDRRQGYRGAVAQFAEDEKLAAWWVHLADMRMPSDLAPWRLAVVLSLDEAEAHIGMLTRDAAIAHGRIGLKGLAWARRAPEKEGGGLGRKPTRPADVLAVGDVVWVSPTRNRGLYELQQVPEVNGALVALDPHTGRVRAMVGGFSFAASEFNRATQAQRQPGSAFKPFVYAAALDAGFTPASLVLDAPFVMEQGSDRTLWKPENYSRRFYGLSTLRLGMEKSRNLMTVRMAQEIGMDAVADYAARFGVIERMPRVLAMALGAGETTLMRLTSAYAMLVNGGKRIEPVFIDRIQDRYGKTLYRNDTRPCVGCTAEAWAAQAPPDLPDPRTDVISPQTAYQLVSMLEGVVVRGTGRRIGRLGKPLAGKTGTTNDNRDAWFVGFSPDLAVGVYVGRDDYTPLGTGEAGGRVAAPIFERFMRELLRDTPVPPFRIPAAVNLVRIDAKTGRPARPEDKTVILEAFKVGTEPGSGRKQRVVRGGTRKTPPSDDAVGVGTGGLY